MNNDRIDPNYLLELKDRGNIKWTAMMITEHRESLFHMAEAQQDVPTPQHDPDILAEMSEVLASAFHLQDPVQLRYWKDKRYIDVTCYVSKLDPYKKAILVSVDEYDKRWIPVKSIVSVETE
jgi:hypothetical protein